jgi:hypothetical protein
VWKWLEDHPQVVTSPLPPYAPNLIPLERVSRFAKDELVENRYHEQNKTFRANAFRLLNDFDDHLVKLKTMINDSFELVQQE